MREKLPRLLSINFSNYVAEDVPLEENRLPLSLPLFHPLDFVHPPSILTLVLVILNLVFTVTRAKDVR